MASHPTALKSMEDKILAEKDVANALAQHANDSAPPASTASGAAAAPAARTLAAPDFDGQPTPDHNRRVAFDEKPLGDFNASHTCLACVILYSQHFTTLLGYIDSHLIPTRTVIIYIVAAAGSCAAQP